MSKVYDGQRDKVYIFQEEIPLPNLLVPVNL